MPTIQVYDVKFDTTDDGFERLSSEEITTLEEEIEGQILRNTIDVGIHSMKDVPASDENPELEIICWFKRENHREALLSNSGQKFFDLSPLEFLNVEEFDLDEYFLLVRISHIHLDQIL